MFWAIAEGGPALALAQPIAMQLLSSTNRQALGFLCSARYQVIRKISVDELNLLPRKEIVRVLIAMLDPPPPETDKNLFSEQRATPIGRFYRRIGVPTTG